LEIVIVIVLAYFNKNGPNPSYTEDRTLSLNARLDSATKLDGAVFSKSFLKMVDISDVSISLDQLNSMFGDASVTLPNNITPDSPDWPAHWPKEELERVSFLTAYDTWLAAQP
jgi:hypothetical protein